MGSFKVVLRRNKKKKNGDIPLYFRVTKSGKSSYKTTGYYVKEIHWDDDKGQVKKNHPNSRWLNGYLQAEILRYQKLELESLEKGKLLNSEKILNGAEYKEQLFFEYAQKLLAQFRHSRKLGTVKRYEAVVNKFEAYFGADSLLLEEITPDLLRDFEGYLKGLGNGLNTIYSNMKVLRTILYLAVDDGLLEYNQNPFLRFKLKPGPSGRVKLTLDEIEAIESLELKVGSKLYLVQNMFLFSFYCAGIRVSDLLQLKWRNVRGERLVFVMEKTGKEQSIKLLPVASKILSRFSKEDEDALIFPMLNTSKKLNDKYVLHRELSSKTALVNKYLKKIAIEANIEKKISSHIARHSFADYARKSGMSIYGISKALRHSNLSVTEKYLAGFDQEALDEEMEKVFTKK